MSSVYPAPKIKHEARKTDKQPHGPPAKDTVLSQGAKNPGQQRESNKKARPGDRGSRPGAATTSIALPSLTRSSVYEPSLKGLRPKAKGKRRLAAVALASVRHIESFMPVQPGDAPEPVRPASFSHIKALQRSPMRFPAPALQPAKLISGAAAAPAQAPQRAAAATASHKSARAAAAPAGASIPAPPTAAPWQDNRKSLSGSRTEPLWHQLFSPESKGGPADSKAESKNEAALALSATARSHSAYDWASAGDIDVEDLTASRVRRKPIEPVQKRYWMWQAVEGVFLSKTFARSLAAVTILLFASTVDVPWKDWLNRQASNIKEPIVAAMDQFSKPLKERAAFEISDDFTSGVDNWVSSNALNVDAAGWLTMSQGLALNEATTDLTDYRLDFDAKIQSKAVGWVVRAPDTENFYEFKLFQGGTASNPTYSLARYSMIDGARTLVAEGIEAPAHLVKADDFNRISMRVVGESVTTLINGWGVDHWRDDAIERGGVGLIADAGESALIREMTVSGNDDTWGLILYGAIESMHSVQEFFGQGQAPAVILFYRPGGMTAGAAPVFLLQGAPASL